VPWLVHERHEYLHFLLSHLIIILWHIR
jgi:hypothetical protein